MFRRSKAAKAQSVAEEAWDTLVSAWDSAKDRTGDLVGDFVGETQDRVGSVTDEAWKRASGALDALSGRRPSTPWNLVFGAIAVGVAVGWVAAAAIGRAPSLSGLGSSSGDSDSTPAG